MGTPQRLIEATAQLLATEGPDVSVRAVCDAVGVTAPTIYRYFGDRRGLLDATIKDAFDRYLTSKRARQPTGDVIEDIRRGWDLHLEFGMRNPVLHELMFPNLDVENTYPAARTGYVMLRDAFERARREKKLNPRFTPDSASRALWAALFGVTRLLAEDPRQAKVINAAVRDAVIDALTNSPTN